MFDISFIIASFVQNARANLDSSSQFCRIFLPEFFKSAFIQSFPDLFHELVVEIQIVHDRKTHGQHLLSNEQMADIGTGIAAADGTVALRIDGLLIQLILGIFQINGTLPCKESCVAGISGRHNAVKEVHATGNGFNNIGGSREERFSPASDMLPRIRSI